LPGPAGFDCDFACIHIGANDAMSICASDFWTDAIRTAKRPASMLGPPMLPDDWRQTCRPSIELFEEGLRTFVKELLSAGRAAGCVPHVAIATPAPLGEDLSDGAGHRKKPAPGTVGREFAAAVRRVAKEFACDVLPVFETMEQRLNEVVPLENRIAWTSTEFGLRMQDALGDPELYCKPLGQLGSYKGRRPALTYDLVHYNESGGALHALLVHEWLEEQLPR